MSGKYSWKLIVTLVVLGWAALNLMPLRDTPFEDYLRAEAAGGPEFEALMAKAADREESGVSPSFFVAVKQVAEEEEINITPMLDVVFILLIFFIVTANFIKEPGLEVNRPDSETAEPTENAAILIAVGNAGEIYMDGRRIDKRQVKANVVRLLAENPQGSVVIQADEKATADTIMAVMDGAREAGVYNISLASEPQF